MPLIYDFTAAFDPAKITKPILLDTNVIVDLFYDKSGFVPNSFIARLTPYHNAINACWSAGLTLNITTQILLEMFHVFTKYDCKVYNHLNNLKLKEKDYRLLQTERNDRSTRYSLIYQQLSNFALNILDVEIDVRSVENFLNSIVNNSLDVNDFLLVDRASTSGFAIMTDDSDFASLMPQCDIITINQNLISAATALNFSLV